MQTLGLSPKAVLAFVLPALTSLAAAVSSLIVTGNWDLSETRVAVGGLVVAAVAALGAYLGHPGDVVAAHVVAADDNDDRIHAPR